MKKTASALPLLITCLHLSSVAHAQTPTPVDSPPEAPSSANHAEASAPAPASASPTPAAPANEPAATRPAPAAPRASATTDTEGSDASDRATPRTRDGFYLRLSSGPSFLSLSGDGPTRSASIAALGSGGSISIGGSIARGVVLAGTVQTVTGQGTFHDGPFRSATISVDGSNIDASHRAIATFNELGALIDWYPNSAAGWHAGLSAGFGVIAIVNSADNSSLYGVSPAGTLFGGYDWAIGRDWSLGLSLQASGAGAAAMKHSPDRTDAGYRLTPASIGIQASVLYF